MQRLTIFAAAGAAFGLAGFAHAQLIVDNFEVDSAGSYTVVNDGTPDGSIDFNFDYVAAGIPLAPNAAAGETGGLRMTANDTAGATDAITAFHNMSLSGSYSMSVDVYMGVTGTGGTTEHLHAGIGGDGVTFNSLFSPISGSGHYITITGEGGSSSDYRHFTPSLTSVPSGDLSYLTPENTTNSTGSLYQMLFPDATSDFAGSPGNQWFTLTIDVDPSFVTYSINGTPIIQTATEDADGFVSLGYADLFTSLASPAQSMFVVYDNLTVVPAPGAVALAGLAGLAGLRRRR